ncbi:MAG: hypothetical protein JSU84_01520, partial [Thiotrichales bacterium]
VAIGLNLGSMIWGFVAGAALALLVGYAYHLWDVQWQKAANKISTVTGIIKKLRSFPALN